MKFINVDTGQIVDMPYPHNFVPYVGDKEPGQFDIIKVLEVVPYKLTNESNNMKNLNNIFESIPTDNKSIDPLRTQPYMQIVDDCWTQLTFDNGHWVKFAQNVIDKSIFAYSDSCPDGNLTTYTADKFVEFANIVCSRQPYPTNYTNVNDIIKMDQQSINHEGTNHGQAEQA